MRAPFLILMTLAAFAYSMPAHARDIVHAPIEITNAIPSRGHGKTFALTGRLGAGSYDRFRKSIARLKPDLIVLDGPGGKLLEAILIGREIRKRGLATAIGQNKTCASACALIYLSGRKKYAGRGAAIGLHSASDDQGRRDPGANQFMLNYLVRVGVPAKLVRNVLVASPNTMRWLDERDRKTLNIRSF